MKAEEEMRQMAIAHDLFCELNPKSKDTAISILLFCLPVWEALFFAFKLTYLFQRDFKYFGQFFSCRKI